HSLARAALPQYRYAVLPDLFSVVVAPPRAGPPSPYTTLFRSAIAHVSTSVTHVAAVAHITAGIAHVAAGIPDFASCCCLTGVTHARHPHEHGVEHHGIAHHPHASGHGICPPWAGVPTSWNRTASNRATWVVVRGFF